MEESAVRNLPRSYDVVIVGGGPAGASTALLCARAGLKVMLLEKGTPSRHKACGGVLPQVAEEVICDIIDDDIPDDVYEEPSELGLFYVPPSGRENGGRVGSYRVVNIDRDRFDSWLLTKAVMAGVKVQFGAEFSHIIDHDRHLIGYFLGGEPQRIRTRILVGADGVRSKVRRAILPTAETPFLLIGQYYLPSEARGEIEDCFYGLFREDISPSYAYVIPKRDAMIIGTGVRPRQTHNLAEAMDRLRDWLLADFNVPKIAPISKEVWSIPYGYFTPGDDFTLLVGDAAGLCNPLSGEGIRLAVESGESASIAIGNAIESEESPLDYYIREVRSIADFVSSVQSFIDGLDDQGREQFVRDELARRR